MKIYKYCSGERERACLFGFSGWVGDAVCDGKVGIGPWVWVELV